MQDPEMPPATDDQPRTAENVDGTVIDEDLLKKAQDEKRLNEWYGLNPNEVPSDETIQAMRDHLEAMTAREESLASGEGGQEIKPLDPVQQEQAKQDSEFEGLVELFKESNDSEHVETTWKLFDEFIDKHSLSREAERTLRDYVMKISREALVSDKPRPESAPEALVLDSDQANEQAPEDQPPETLPEGADEGSSESAPTEGGEVAPEGTVPAPEGSESSTTTSELTAEGDAESSTTNVSNDDAERGVPTAFGGVEGSNPNDSVYPIEETGEAIDFPEANDEENEKSFTEKLKRMWARVKSAPAEVAASIESYFVTGTPEQNAKNRNIAIAAGVAATAVCIAIEIFDKSGSAHQVSGNIIHSTGGALQPIVPHFSGHDVLHNVVEHVNSSGEVIRSLHEHLSSGGDSIWNHVSAALERFHIKPTNHNIYRLTSDVLKQQGLSWDGARHLPNGYEFTINLPSWLK